MTQLGQAYLKDESFSKGIKNYEHACMILSWLEAKEEKHKGNKLTLKLDNLYLQLVDLYLTIEKPVECESII